MIMTRFRAKAVMTPLCGVQAIDIDQLESLHMHARGYAAVGHMVKTAPAATLAPAHGNGGAGGMAANVKVVNLLDPGDVMEAGVSRSIGEKEFFNFITRNSRATEGGIVMTSSLERLRNQLVAALCQHLENRKRDRASLKPGSSCGMHFSN